MVLCHDKFRQRGLSMKQIMFELTNGLSIETQRATLLSNSNSDNVNSEASSMVVSPTAATTASIITPSISIESSNAEQNGSVKHDTSPINSSSYEQSGGGVSSGPTSSSVSSAISEHGNSFHTHLSSGSSAQTHYVPMYGNGNSLFGANNSTPSTIAMTPPSTYGNDLSESSLMQHSWYQQTMRSQHPAYSEMISASEWPNSIGNSSFSSSTTSPLSAYPMSLQNPYSAQINPVYHPHGSCRPSGTSTLDFYESRFPPTYHAHPHYYQNPFFNSTSPPGAANGHFTPLSVGTDVGQMSFAASSLLNSSPDSGVTLSSEGNESPSIGASHPVSSDHSCVQLGSGLSSQTRAAARSHLSAIVNSNNSDLEVDIKPSLASLQSASTAHASHLQQQQQEATSTTTPNNSVSPTVHHQAGPNNHNDIQYSWMKKSSNSNSSQSSTGKTRTKDKYRVVYTENQRLELEKEFHYSRYITIKRKSELANQLSLSERQVKIWFQNRRAKDRKQTRKRDEIQKKDKTKDGNNSANGTNGSNGTAGAGMHHPHPHSHHNQLQQQQHQSSTPGVLVVPKSSSNEYPHQNILVRGGGLGAPSGGAMIHRNHNNNHSVHQLGHGHALPGSIAHSRQFGLGPNNHQLHSPPSSNLHQALNGTGGSGGSTSSSSSNNSSSNGSGIIQAGYHRDLLSGSMSSTPTVVSEINH